MFRLLRDVLALPRCTGCGAPGPEWCDRCALHLPDVRWHLIADELPLCTAFAYDGPIRQTIIDWKEHHHAAATARVRSWFCIGLTPILERIPDLQCVPIPSSPHNDRLRGGPVLADTLREIGVQVFDGLVSRRGRSDQAGLSRHERELNLKHAFAWRQDIDVPVLLVDDVVTSGATMRSAADAILSGGGRVWAAFGLARRGRLATVHSSPKGLAWGNPTKGGLP